MKKPRVVLPYLATVFLVAACTKDELPARPASTSTYILLAKNWRITSDVRTLTPAGSTTSSAPDELYDRYTPCQQDNFWQFATGDKLLVDEGATSCNTSSPQTTVGTWTLSADAKTLLVVIGARSTSYEVLSLTPSTLIIHSSWITPEDIKVNNTYTFGSL